MPRSTAFSIRLKLCLALLTFGGCQCLQPVDERDSGASDGGPRADGGCQNSTDCPKGGDCSGGAPYAWGYQCIDGACQPVEAVCPFDGGSTRDAGACNTPNDCRGTPSSSRWCNNHSAGFSCVEHACIWECPTTAPGRTCGIEQTNYCRHCGSNGDGGVNCPLTGTTQCGDHFPTITVEETSCSTWPDSGTPFTQVQFMRGASARCSWLVHNPDHTEVLGTVWRLDNYEFIAYFPGLGGWCVGRSAFTGVPRSLFSCPKCEFTLQGFD